MKEYKKLIEEHQATITKNKAPSFFDICKYPHSRFEEVSSRVLAFYFSPHNPHGNGTIFLETLITIINVKLKKKKPNLFIENVNIELEKYAFGRRIDIYIESENFVIGIENKINAKLYNKLEDYKNKINNSGKNDGSTYKVILSVRELNIKEKAKAKEEGFIFISYQEFILEVNKKALNTDNKYFFFWKEFYSTIEKIKHNYMNEKEITFFNKNSKEIDQLLAGYKKYQDKIVAKQKKEIEELTNKISRKTIKEKHLSKWWNPSKELGYNVSELDKKGEKVHIGLVGKFIAKGDNPLAIFEIHIKTFWKRSFDHYEQRLRSIPNYGTIHNDKNDNFIVYKIITNDVKNEEQNFEEDIIKNLEIAFNLVNNI